MDIYEKLFQAVGVTTVVVITLAIFYAFIAYILETTVSIRQYVRGKRLERDILDLERSVKTLKDHRDYLIRCNESEKERGQSEKRNAQ